MSKEQFKRNKPHVTLEPPPPPPPPPDGMTGSTTSGVLTTLSFSFTTTDDAGSYYAVYGTPGLANGVTKPNQGLYRFLGSIENSSLANTLDILTLYNAKFPNAEAGSQIFVRLSYINSTTGQRWELGQWKAIISGT